MLILVTIWYHRIKKTDWGALDVLLLDLPPGTGDIPLSICQSYPLSGVVSVSTPSKLALRDAEKGFEMFQTMGVPTLALVQNMAFLDVDSKRIFPFGQGNVDFGVENVVRLPLSLACSEGNENGLPIVLNKNEDFSVESRSFSQLSDAVARELFLIQHGKKISNEEFVEFQGRKFSVSNLRLSMNNESKEFIIRLFADDGALEIHVDGIDIRMRHPKSGKILVDHDDTPATANGGCGSTGHGSKKNLKLFPAKTEKRGHHGYLVDWADGAIIIYSMMSLAQAAITSGRPA